ncbi:ankyrin repeat protein [Colletotrichum truncatum]|uniref:Ankyrin repeat protein n=1 Tax=Colletotrichum truncatum TaxID=5467 RepID=A0ACC3YNU0_COLTU|nr:ankyrin repeat protein [Colletotrichum truncatum]KAF6791432.1 ankyrin repeat protein [Colletotrichum truncatum]
MVHAPARKLRPVDEFLPRNTQQISVDIVAVHGLGSSPETAWAYRRGTSPQDASASEAHIGPLWLKDFLPLDELRARVLVYYHNSGWQAHATSMSLRGYGQDLLTSIEVMRQNDEERTRPIMFIGYSFGGLIIKQAMIMASSNDVNKSRRRLSSDLVKGFIFLGTPHNGSSLTFLAKAMSLLSFWQGANTTLLEVLDQDSRENELLHRDFMKYCGKKDMVNFYEVQAERMGRFALANAVSEKSATIDGKINIPSPGQHREIHRFNSNKDVGYTRLCEYITTLIHDNIEQKDSRRLDVKLLSGVVEQTLRELRESNSHVNLDAMEWFMHGPEYMAWLTSPGARFLWYHDPPGMGKTMILRHVVEQLQLRYSSFRTYLAFFFCSRKLSIPLSGTPQLLTSSIASATIVASIISQFADKAMLQHIPLDVQEHLSNGHQHLGHEHEAHLWEILSKILLNILSSQKEVWIVLDGVDELLLTERSHFMHGLRSLWNDLNSGSRVEHMSFKVLLASRPYQDIQEILDGLPFVNLGKESADCLNSLALKANNERRSLVSIGEESTGAWLWEDDSFKDWSNQSNSSFLWIQGKPGSGKSTLSKKILRHIIQKYELPDYQGTFGKAARLDSATLSGLNDTRSVLVASFFYSLRGAKSDTNNTQMLQSLLWQLLYQEQKLYPMFRETYRDLLERASGRPSAIDWSFDDLQKVFQSLKRFDDFPLRVFLVVDGMDESDKLERERVLLLLQHLCAADSACVTQCVLASRPEDDIKSNLLYQHGINHFFHMILEKKNASDIKRFIDVKMAQLQNAYLLRLSTLSRAPMNIEVFKDIMLEITTKLEKEACGVFLWVEIVTREMERCLRHGYTAAAMRKTIENLPQDLEPFYERIIGDLLKQYEKDENKQFNAATVVEARRMLTWVTYAERPLNLVEFCDAIAIPDTVTPISGFQFQDFRLPEELAMRQRLEYVCGDLLEIRSIPHQGPLPDVGEKEDMVQLLHLTVREFLTRDKRAGPFCLKRLQGEYEILQNSICYLRLFVESCPSIHEHPELQELERGAEYLVRELQSWPLLYYVLRFLPRHIQNCGQNSERALQLGKELADFVLNHEGNMASPLLESWFRATGLGSGFMGDRREDARQFRFACMDSALEVSNVQVAVTLLETEVASTFGTRSNIDEGNDTYSHILHQACRNDAISIVRLLLEMGVPPDIGAGDGETGLRIASETGNASIADMLLRHGADIDFTGIHGTALRAAAKAGHMELVQLLIERGADVNWSNADGTALEAASKAGYIDIVHWLLIKGADVNLIDIYGTALWSASKAGHVEVARLLIEFGADVNQIDAHGTALEAALKAGHMEVVRLLIEHGADAQLGTHGTTLGVA